MNNAIKKTLYLSILKKHLIKKRFLTFKLFNNIINKINSEVINNNYELIINKSLFTKDKTYESFKNQHKGHNSFIISNDKENLYPGVDLFKDLKIISSKISEIEKIEVHTLEEQEKDEDIPIENIYTLDNFLIYVNEQINKKILTLNEEQKEKIKEYEILKNEYHDTQYYIVDPLVDMDNLGTLNNKEFDKYQILPNPLNNEIKIKKGDERDIYTDKYRNVIKTKIRILKPTMDTAKGLTLVTKYVYKCPHCSIKFYKQPYELAKALKHACPGEVDNKGRQVYNAVDKEMYKIENKIELFLYDFEIITEGGKYNTKEIVPRFTLYVNNIANLKPGIYNVELLMDDITLKRGDKSQHNMIYLISIEPVKPKVSKELIISNSGKKISEELQIPHVKILDILQSIRDIYQNYTKNTITNKGMWIQLTTLISGLGRTLFNYRVIAISVMANMTLSKTYPSTRIGLMIDPGYYFSQSSNDVSTAGLTGGISNSKNINGKTISIFEAGLVTSTGLCIFDEASRFFIDQQLNDSIKSLHNNTIKIDKIKGQEAVQNYTPIMLSNFGMFDRTYKKQIKEKYIKLKRAELNKENKLLNATEVENKLNNIDYYLPLQAYVNDYKDETLLKAIAHVRVYYEQHNKQDWKTGGRIESSNRIFFDVVVDNKQKTIADGYKPVIEDSELMRPDAQDLPIFEFQEELKIKFLGDKYFDLNQKTEQTIKISDSITKWLKGANGEPNDVFKWYTHGTIKIDEKINSVLYRVCTIIQLLEDIDSTELSPNVKKFLEILLSKNKKGLTADEYDFKVNNTHYDMVNYNMTGISLELIEAEELAEKNRMHKKVEEEFYAKKKEQYEKNKVELNPETGGTEYEDEEPGEVEKMLGHVYEERDLNLEDDIEDTDDTDDTDKISEMLE